MFLKYSERSKLYSGSTTTIKKHNQNLIHAIEKREGQKNGSIVAFDVMANICTNI